MTWKERFSSFFARTNKDQHGSKRLCLGPDTVPENQTIQHEVRDACPAQ